MKEEEIESILSNTMLLERIKKIREVYNTLSQKQNEYASVFNICCTKGCGTCCERFNPDISEVEAEFLAFGLISENREDEIVSILQNSDETHCPLYNKQDSEHHCSVYKWRPLICRLFGFSASLDKQGKPVYRSCKFNSNPCRISTQMLEEHKDAVVVMKDYGLMVAELDSEQGRTELVQTALPRAIEKVKLMITLEKLEKNEDGEQDSLKS